MRTSDRRQPPLLQHSELGGLIEKLRRGQRISPAAIDELDRTLLVLRGEGWSGIFPADQALRAVLTRVPDSQGDE
jgi:hypothetical protein